MQKLDLLFNSVPFILPDADLALVTISNITDIKDMERKRIATLESLSEIGKNASIIIHDLKNPLSGVLGYAELLKESLKDEKCLSYCESIESSGYNILKMIKEITKIATDKSNESVEYSEINVEIFINNVVSALKLKNKLILNLKYKGNILIDKSRIERVIWNLLENADHVLGDYENGTIEISSYISDQYVTICITDNGPGINENIKDKLFDFGQTFGKADGHGIGLYSSKKLIEAHKGKLSFESTPGKGTSFFIQIP